MRQKGTGVEAHPRRSAGCLLTPQILSHCRHRPHAKGARITSELRATTRNHPKMDVVGRGFLPFNRWYRSRIDVLDRAMIPTTQADSC